MAGGTGWSKKGIGKSRRSSKPRFDTLALLEVLENPLRRLFRKPALASAADDYRNSCHIVFLLLVLFRAFVASDDPGWQRICRYHKVPSKSNQQFCILISI